MFYDAHRSFHKDEVDASGAGFDSFNWYPLNPNQQRYEAGVTCRDGIFQEKLWFVRDRAGGFDEAIRLSQLFPYTKTGQEKILFECYDGNFQYEMKDLPSASSGSCFTIFTEHLGEPKLPFQPPINNAVMFYAVFIFAYLVYLPLYCLLAYWWIDVAEQSAFFASTWGA